jgi:hypothetical protein
MLSEAKHLILVDIRLAIDGMRSFATLRMTMTSALDR